MPEPTNTDILIALRDVAAALSAKIDAVDAKLSARIDELDVRLSGQISAIDARLSEQISAIAADQQQLKADLQQLQHVTSANGFKLVGRIDQVASMLADHMADTAGHTRKRA